MNLEILFVTCNRLDYTKKALASVLADNDGDFTITIWDNVSTDGTAEYLDSVKDPRITKKFLSKENLFITGAANKVFRESKADLLAIIPDDFIVPSGWTRPLAAVHADVPMAGLISCWFLGREYFNEAAAKSKIQTFGGHRILRHPWTGGGAALFKRNAWEKAGGFDGRNTPECWKRMAAQGYINGFLVPPIFVDHMDDPWSPHYCGRPNFFRIESGRLDDEVVKQFHRAVVREILTGPWDIKWYMGWRAKVRNLKKKVERRLSFS